MIYTDTSFPELSVTLVMAGVEDGGMEKHVLELAAGLAEAGLAITLIAHPRYQAMLSTRRVTFMPVDLGKSRRNPMVLLALRKALYQSRPGLIHVHGNKAAAMVGSLKSWLPPVPLLATFHSSRGKASPFKRFDHIIAVSERSASVIRSQLPSIPLSIIHNGIQPPVKIGHPERKPDRLLAIGRLVSIKNYSALIEAIRGLPVTLWIAGDGPEKDSLQQQIVQSGQQGQVTLLGHREDVTELLQHAGWHIISSVDEGGPYTLAEALLLECPVLATPVGMVADYLDPRWISSDSTVASLRSFIQTSITVSLEERQIAFVPAFTRAQQELTFDAMCGQVLALYQQVCGNSPATEHMA